MDFEYDQLSKKSTSTKIKKEVKPLTNIRDNNVTDGEPADQYPAIGTPYTWTSRGPLLTDHLGVCIAAPGAAISPVPTWNIKKNY